MFEDLFTRPSALARHRDAPYGDERARYLAYCAQRGDSHATLLLKARTLVWVARQLGGSSTLSVTIDQVRAAAGSEEDRWRRRGSSMLPGHGFDFSGVFVNRKTPFPSTLNSRTTTPGPETNGALRR